MKKRITEVRSKRKRDKKENKPRGRVKHELEDKPRAEVRTEERMI